MTKEKKHNRFVVLSLACIFIFLNLVFARYQQQVTFNNGLEFDGIYYAKVTEDFRNGLKPTTSAPYVYRIGVPFLASFFELDTIVAWRYIGHFGNILVAVLLYIFLSVHIRQVWIRFILMLMFLLPFHSVIRRVWHTPMTIDHIDKIFLILGLILMHQIKVKNWDIAKTVLLSFITFLGVFFREIILVVPIAALFITNPLHLDSQKLGIRKIVFPPALAFLPLLAGVVSFFIVKLTVNSIEGQFFFDTAARLFFTKKLHEYFLGWFIAFGPLLILPVYDWRQVVRYLSENQHYLVYLAAFSVLGWIGGVATYRLLQWGTPIVFLLIGLSIENNFENLRRNYLFLALCSVFYLISQRVFWFIPDYPGGESTLKVFLTPLSSNAPYLEILGMESTKVMAMSFGTYMFALVVLLFVLCPPKILFKN